MKKGCGVSNKIRKRLLNVSLPPMFISCFTVNSILLWVLSSFCQHNDEQLRKNAHILRCTVVNIHENYADSYM